MDWGSLPDWIASVGTCLALSLSAAITLSEIRQRKHAQALLQRERVRARASDAHGVVAWLEVQATSGPHGPRTLMHVQNSSPRPVFSLEVTPCAYGFAKRDQAIEIPVLGPGSTLSEDFDAALDQFVILQDLPDVYRLDPAGRIGFRMIFRDSDGIGWERTLHGDLHEVPVENIDWQYDSSLRRFTHQPWSRPEGWTSETE